jgi:Ni,Fe-hydrogenase III large subunit
LRQSRAYADETAEALRRTQVRLDQETESLKFLEHRLEKETESLKLLERQLQLTEERLNQSVREANQVGVAYQELRAYVDRLKAHPVLALALTRRREVRNLVSRFKARRHAE